MKSKFLPIILLIIPSVTLFLSVSLGISMGFSFQHGWPAYVLETSTEVDYAVSRITHVDFKIWNVLGMFFLLSIPVFVSGYLWAKSKYKPSEPED